MIPQPTEKLGQPRQEGECCIEDCNNAAVHYDSDNYGYCLSHWQGSGGLEPGQECAELMFKGKQHYWVKGTYILDDEKLPFTFKRKKCKGLKYIYTYKPTNHKPVQTLKRTLLPIRPGMPKVKLWEWEQVFDRAVYAGEGASSRVEVDLEALAEDREDAELLMAGAEGYEVDGQLPPAKR